MVASNRPHALTSLSLLAPILAIPFATPAQAASGNLASLSGSAGATVLGPITLTHIGGAELRFGTVFPGTGGTATVDSAGNGSTGGGVSFMPGQPSKADSFRVDGEPNTGYAIVTGAGTLAAGSDVLAFTTTPSSATATLNASGRDTFSVGGTLVVPGGTHPGHYSGSYTVSVAYN